MECQKEKNKQHCNCTYDCDLKGMCCQCIKEHRENGELPACYFSEELEKTYNRSIENFIKDREGNDWNYEKTNAQNRSKKNIISKNVFDREIKLCQQLNKESNSKGCNWGKCENCGVLPLLIKLHKGILIEDKKELKDIKETIL